ncbi:MAG: hypothetical protein H6R26_2474 [Proteobacteria bacterium]|nr:hypothetical protein [Pseudomonadota bacterium]
MVKIPEEIVKNQRQGIQFQRFLKGTDSLVRMPACTAVPESHPTGFVPIGWRTIRK